MFQVYKKRLWFYKDHKHIFSNDVLYDVLFEENYILLVLKNLNRRNGDFS